MYVAYTFIYSTYNYASQTHGIMQCVYGTNEYNKNIAVIYLEHKKNKKQQQYITIEKEEIRIGK